MFSAADRPADDGRREALGQFLLNLRVRGFRDNGLLTAIENAPRAEFLPLPYIGFAYQEIAIPIACGQQATAPTAVIEAVSALGVETHHNVLEIGTGSGWQTAILAGMARAVVSIDRFQSLAREADERLQRRGFANVVVTHGDGSEGLAAAAPFHRIILNAAVSHLPDRLPAQLTQGGVIVAPVVRDGAQRLRVFEKRAGALSETDLGPSSHPLLMAGTAAAL